MHILYIYIYVMAIQSIRKNEIGKGDRGLWGKEQMLFYIRKSEKSFLIR